MYVLGCIDRRVTIYSQQVRGLNLAAALVAGEQVSVDDDVVVVGAGAAGLTCAAGLRRLGAKVTVLEKNSTILSLFRLGSQRWLHPGVYDWPLDGWNRDRAGLPVLDWEHGQVNSVLRQLEDAWEQEGDGANLCFDVGLIGIGDAGEQPRRVTWETGTARTRTVILAVGFGLEPTPLADERSYWEADSFDYDRKDGPQRWLVSGCGDGALTDLFRLCIQDFRHDRVLLDFTEDQRMGELREQIRQIEANASIQRDPAKLHDAYEHLNAPWVVEAMQQRARSHNVTLVAPTADFLNAQASPLNRFLAGQLFRARRFRFLQDRLKSVDRANGKVVVRFKNSAVQHFDRIQRRHGPESALASGFPAIAEAVEKDRRDRQVRPTLTDQTRDRFWVAGAFGEPRTPGGVAAARAAAARTSPRREQRPNAGAFQPDSANHIAGSTQLDRDAAAAFVDDPNLARVEDELGGVRIRPSRPASPDAEGSQFESASRNESQGQTLLASTLIVVIVGCLVLLIVIWSL
ncbi:FAD-dependent oxidoreductase [Enhygromyxa salina]|uniref:FAD-dependent oxidoreductase n=1 Tax=Enhygromyxa salina TaxID=215803 RepID=UPI001C629908|nr:FAD-dependent oxidoreductase [Enhygromyxa salina]